MRGARRHVLAVSGALGAGCVPAEATPQRMPHDAPTDATLADCAPFAFAPADGARRCAASPVVDGLAVEKTWVPDRMTGHIEWTLLVDGPGGWARHALGAAHCGGEVPAGCDHDETFRRTFAIRRDVDRAALQADPVAPRPPGLPATNDDAAYVVYFVAGAAPYVHMAAESVDGPRGLLERAPADLAGVYAADLDRGTPVIHATEAWDAGVAGPRSVLKPLLATPKADCSSGPGTWLSGRFQRERPDDPWTVEVIAPWYGACVTGASVREELALPRACRDALATCGLTVGPSVPVDIVTDVPHVAVRPRSDVPTMFTLDEAPRELITGAPTWCVSRSPRRIRSTAPVVWLGPEPVRGKPEIEAPLVIAPAAGPLPAGWCPIAKDACPVPPR